MPGEVQEQVDSQVQPLPVKPSGDELEEKTPDNGDATRVKEPGNAVTREKHDDPQPQLPEADDFGLPVRPPRRRQYTLESLDSPGDIEKQVVKDIESSPAVARARVLSLSSQPPAQQDLEKDAGAGEDGGSDAPKVIEAGTENKPNGEQDRPKTPVSQTGVTSPTGVQSPSSPSSTRHTRAKPSVSEWSHQVMAPREEEEKLEEDDGEWQPMPAFASHTVYDDWGKVVAKDYSELDENKVAYGTLGGAGKGYTRVQMDEDAQSATSMDDNTAYLFKDSQASNILYDDDEVRDALSQRQMTKEMLTESQRIAYVGVVRLLIVKLANELGRLDKNRNTKKALEFASESSKMWGQKIMVRLYAHMDIGEQEQVMIEQLAEHGVLPSDLAPQLMANARLKKDPSSPRPSTNGSSARPSLSSPRSTSMPEVRTSSPHLSAPPTPVTPAGPPAYGEHTADQLTIQDPADIEDVKSLELDIRWTVLCDLFLLLLADSSYDSRSRTLLEHVGAELAVDWQEISRFEKRVTDALEMQEQAEKENWNEDEHLEARKKADRKKRLLIMGLCTVGGGLVIGLSAGALAPVIGAGLAAGFTGIGITGTGTFLGGAGAAALIGTGGGLIGARTGLNTSNRRTGAVKTFEYKPLYNNKRTNLIVTVAGWMTGKVDDVRLPFSTVNPIMGDIYAVNWEPEMLQSTGQTVQILATEALTQTIQQILGATVLATLMAGLSTPIVLAKISYLIDNPWTVSLARADSTGLILADSIIDRNLGMRPITLVGFSLGSRVIWSCLKELAKRGAIGLIQNVYMFGSPVVAKTDEYIKARSIVSGRFVNAYATNDWILGYLFRATSGGIMRVSGLASVNVPGIENYDITEHVPGHMAYRGMMPVLLHEVGWQVESLEFTEIEDPDPENHEQRQRELLHEIEEARKQMDEQPEKRGFKSFFSRKKAPQKKAWETYDERSARVLDGDEKESERVAEENGTVLFDVEAIRKEALALALQNPNDLEEIKSHLSIREIQSTLPTLKVTMPTDISNGPTSASPRPDLRQTQSMSNVPRTTTNSLNGGQSSSTSVAHPDDERTDDREVTLSFESPERPAIRASSSHAANGPSTFAATPATALSYSPDQWTKPEPPGQTWAPSKSGPSSRNVSSTSVAMAEHGESRTVSGSGAGLNPWDHGDGNEAEEDVELSFE